MSRRSRRNRGKGKPNPPSTPAIDTRNWTWTPIEVKPDPLTRMRESAAETAAAAATVLSMRQLAASEPENPATAETMLPGLALSEGPEEQVTLEDKE